MLACLPTKVCPPTALASNLVWLTVRLASPAPKISGVMLAIFSTKARPPKALLSNHVWLAVLRASAAPAKARSGVLPTLALRRLVWWLRRCRWAYRDARHMGRARRKGVRDREGRHGLVQRNWHRERHRDVRAPR